MPRATPYWASFGAGEWSPLLIGRTDLQQYGTSAEIMENFLPLPQGPVVRRPGTLHIAATRNNAPARMVPFVFGAIGTSVVDAYTLEFTDLAMRVYRDRVQVMNMAGTTPYTISTPYSGGEVPDFSYTQSEDVLFIAHANHRPARLERRGNADWSLVGLALMDGPYLPINTLSITITPSALTGTITLTASSPIFDAGQVGGLFRIQTRTGPAPTDTVAWSWVEITGFTSTTEVTAEVRGDDLLSLDPTDVWREGAFSAYRGYPSVVAIHDGRLWFGATRTKPTTLWASKVGIFDDFGISDPLVDDDALSFTLAGKRMNTIRWMASKRSLIVGTYGGEWTLSGAGGGAITPSSVNARQDTAYGCNAVDPVEIGNTVFFAQRGGQKLIGLAYRFEDDSLAGQDMTLLASHVAQRGGIVDLAYTATPLSIIWAVRGDGLLLSLVYDRDQKIMAWSRHFTDGVFESITSIPAPDGLGDDLYCVLLHPSIDLPTRRHVIVLTLPSAIVAPQNDAGLADTLTTYAAPPTPPYLDDAKVFVSADPVDHVAGMGYLEGTKVAVMVDEVYQGQIEVVGGQVQLEAPGRKVECGISYLSTLRPQRPEAGTADGTSQNRKGTVGKMRVRVRRSIGGNVSIDGGKVATLIPRSTGLPIDAAPVPFSGVADVSPRGGYNEDRQVTITADEPYPLCIISITPTVTVND